MAMGKSGSVDGVRGAPSVVAGAVVAPGVEGRRVAVAGADRFGVGVVPGVVPAATTSGVCVPVAVGVAVPSELGVLVGVGLCVGAPNGVLVGRVGTGCGSECAWGCWSEPEWMCGLMWGKGFASG